MITDKLFAGGSEVRLSKRLAKGGEGEVYTLISDPAFVFKAYFPNIVREREQKVRAMVDANLHLLMSTAAFPVKVVTNEKGAFVGFLMRLVPDHKEAHELTTPSSRQKHFPTADYRFLVRVAINVARAFGQVHAAGCVIGDINQRSIMISQQATVALIDTDSFQVTRNGQQYLCVVGVPEYTPPELQGQSLKNSVRTPDHDAFGLAVAIFQILCMDRHPFSGRNKGGGGDISIEQAIKDFRFAYSTRDTKMEPPPSTVRLSDLTQKVRENFELAFSRQGVGRRPSSVQWIEALEELERSLRPCSNNKAHHYSRLAAECPWCRMEQAFGVPMFINRDTSSFRVAPGSINDKFGLSFNVAAIESMLHSLSVPQQIAIMIPAAKGSYSPSTAALAFSLNNTNSGFIRIVGRMGLAAAAVLFFVEHVPKIVPIVVAIGSALMAFRGDDPGNQFTQQYNGVAEKVRARIQHLQSNAPAERANTTRNQVDQKIGEYKALVNDFSNIEKDYSSVRRQQQLDAHLASFSLRGARIPKLTSGDIASLASYGFTTAYDAKNRDVKEAHGIGPVKSSSIMTWVAAVERKFVFRQEFTSADRDAIRLKRDNIISRQQGCADSLTKLIEQLKIDVKAIADWISGRDSQLQQHVEELAQAEADLKHLKRPVPGIGTVAPYIVGLSKHQRSSPYASSGTQPSARPHTPPRHPSGSTTSGTPSCPICGSRMRYRTARRGYRAGRSFWGCSRYPTCHGTRNP